MIMKNYIKQHNEQHSYESETPEAGYIYTSKNGWRDFMVNDSMIFSYRDNQYTSETFYEGFHSHDYYEVVFYLSGRVEYVCENDVFRPCCGMVVATLPDAMHTARLVEDSRYERFVLYFKRDFFSFCGQERALPAFFEANGSHGVFQPDDAMCSRMHQLLREAAAAAELATPEGRVLAYSYIVQFFALMSGISVDAAGENDKLPENVARIKKYIDTYYSSIEGVSEIASYFFYSREHASRLFRQYFNITLSEYLMQRRVAESARLLSEGQSVTQACYAVGFRSVSSFINAFRRIMGCLPSEYKRRK